MGLLKLAGALLAFQAFITLQGCGGDGDDEAAAPAAEAATTAPDAAPTPTPAPTPVIPEATKIVTGDLAFAMDATSAAAVTAAFEDPDKKAEVSAAFATSLADGLDGIAADDITITNIYFKAARRMQGLSERRLSDGELVVEYEIKVAATVDTATVTAAVTTIDTTEVTAAVTTELKKVDGLDAVEVGEMKAPEAPEEADACVAELGMVDKEMREKPDGKEMDIDKACKAFRGFKKYCTKDDWSKVDAKELPDDAPEDYDELMKVDNMLCGACGFGMQKMNKIQMEQMKDDHDGHDHDHDRRALTPIRVLSKAFQMPNVRAPKLRIPSIVVPRFSFHNFGRRLERHGGGGDHDGHDHDDGGDDFKPSKAWCDEADKLFKDGSDCKAEDFNEMMEGMESDECGKGDHDGHDKGDYDKGDYDKGDYDKGDYDKGDYDKGDYDKGDYDKGGHDHDDMVSGYGYGYGIVEEEIVDDHGHEDHHEAPERPMDRGDMPHHHDGMEHIHPGGDMKHDHEDHGEECGPPPKHKDMKMMSKMMCSPCMGLMDDMGKAMDKPDSKMEEVCAAGGPIDKFKKGCPAEDFEMMMEMMEGGDDHDDDRRRLDGHGGRDGPPECVSACDGDICCDGGICSDCSTSSCSQDDMAMIAGECARQNAQGSGMGSGSGSGGMMMMPKTKAGMDGLYACMCATSSMQEKGEDYKPTCADVAELQAALTASDCTDEGLAMMMGPGAPPVAEFATVMGEMEGLTDC